MKTSKLISLLKSQVELYGDLDVEVCTTKEKYTDIYAVTSNIFGTIQIIIK